VDSIGHASVAVASISMLLWQSWWHWLLRRRSVVCFNLIA